MLLVILFQHLWYFMSVRKKNKRKLYLNQSLVDRVMSIPAADLESRTFL